MRVAYTDPPYPGQAHLYKDHPDFGGEVDHAALIASLAEYDAWVFHTNAPSLRKVLELCPPEVRIGAWVKSFASFKPNVTIAFAWEPVLFAGGRPRPPDLPTLTDYVIAPIMLQKGCAGAKPPVVCRWAFEMLGLTHEDELFDLFPGSGAVTEAWEAWRQAPTLRLADWAGPRGSRESPTPIEGFKS